MEKKKKLVGVLAVCCLGAFALWTALVCTVDVQPVGPADSSVGFASLNSGFHRVTGVRWFLYTVTDRLGLIPLGIALGHALEGLLQWIRRKSILRVDKSLLALGVLYGIVLAVYVFFELAEVNSRPVLINGVLETSYPSSTTVLAACVMPTAMLRCRLKLSDGPARRLVLWAMAVFTAFMVVGRLLSGVHWLTDIIGGLLLSVGLVLLFARYGGFDP